MLEIGFEMLLKSLQYEKEIVTSMPLQSGTQEMSEVLCH